MNATRSPDAAERRRRLLRRTLPIAAAAGVAFVAGAVVAGTRASEQERLAERFVRAWMREDYARMHAQLSDADRRAITAEAFARAYRAARVSATATGVRPGPVRQARDDEAVVVPMAVPTRVFGTIRARLHLPVVDDDGEPAVDWAPHLTFPGVRPGEELTRETELAPRADLLARDGTPLAQDEDRGSPLGAVASTVAGQLGAPPPARAERLRALGFPPRAQVGVTGLERVFDGRLAGRPGGVLRAGGEVLARARPRAGRDVRTSIDVEVQQAAVAALAGRLGAVAALHPRTGEILALSGIALSGLQPPGSTFKIVTLAGALEAGVATAGSSYPVQTAATLEGVEIENANGESCGGSLRLSFAHSCNSVFAPMGARLGAARLVRAAEAFGFNRPPGIRGAATSTIPPPAEIGDDLAVGATAIGQGRVQATALQMGWVAATIAGRGRRPQLTVELDAPTERPRTIDAGVARTIGRYMVAVVEEGTGAAADLDGAQVAGKTGTAELRDSTADCEPAPDDPAGCPREDDPTDTDAWFAAYAPASDPRVAVGVLLVQNGTGAETAAPAAAQVLRAAL